jgi:hypothetical protein
MSAHIFGGGLDSAVYFSSNMPSGDAVGKVDIKNVHVVSKEDSLIRPLSDVGVIC